MDTQPPTPAILLVDDDEALLRCLRLLLRRTGIPSVLTESDSRRVIARLSREPIALVVLDIIMPHLDGETLLARITRDFPQVGVIMLSANDDPELTSRCRQRGALDYLVKPVEREQLVAAVKRYSTMANHPQ